MGSFNVNLKGRGLRGESFADVARRVGIGGISIPTDATDEEVMNLLVASVALTGANTYPDTASGLADVGEGESFWVADEDGLRLYRKVSGSAVVVNPFTSADNISSANGGNVQDHIDLYEGGLQIDPSEWSLGGGRNIVTNPDINMVAPGINSATIIGGRGYTDDPNQIDGERYRNSYRNYIGYVRTGQTDIGGVLYDDIALATTINPSANSDLSAIIGSGDCFVASLASSCAFSQHCDVGPWGSHSWISRSTYCKSDGFYDVTEGSVECENYGNRSLNLNSFGCRIGTQGTDTASAIANASLCRHSANIGSDTSTIDAAYAQNIGTRHAGIIRDFARNQGFGVSGEIYNGFSYGFAFNTRGDNQVTRVLLSRTNTTGSAITLAATGDWQFKASATTKERTNANGAIVIGQNTTLGISANIMAMQKGGTGYYRSRLEILARMDGAGTATLIDATEYEKKTNKDTGTPSTSWVVDCTVNATTGVVAIRFKGLAGETVIINADCSIARLRALSPGVAIVPPTPFEVLAL